MGDSTWTRILCWLGLPVMSCSPRKRLCFFLPTLHPRSQDYAVCPSYWPPQADPVSPRGSWLIEGKQN